MAEDMNVPFLGSLPLDPRIGKAFIEFSNTAAVFKMNYMKVFLLLWCFTAETLLLEKVNLSRP